MVSAITTLAAHLNAAEGRFLALIAAQDKVRVARALEAALDILPIPENVPAGTPSGWPAMRQASP